MSKHILDIEIKFAFKAPWKYYVFKSNKTINNINRNAPFPVAAALVDAPLAPTLETTVPAHVEQVNVFLNYNIKIFQNDARKKTNRNELRQEKRKVN